MKLNKYTSILLGLGVLSLAGVAQAANPVVYLAGASALRSTLYTVATSSQSFFDGGVAGSIVSAAPNNTSSSTYIVFEGPINGVTTDISIFWTGAEAGVADVAGNLLTQTLNNGNVDPVNGVGTFPVPGSPGTFLTQSSGWTTTAKLSQISGAPSVADLALDDTSQAVSLTPKALYNLTDYGAIAVVPFSFLKGYESSPDSAWNHVVNVTTAEINQIYSAPASANFVTGVPADSGDYVALTGRNLSSGTRVNALLTSQYGVTKPVDQWAYDVSYSGPGVLAAGTSYSSPGALTEIQNDGFNSSGTAAAQLNFDGTGQGVVLIEPLAVPDAASAHSPTAGGAATYLPYNGVYESDAAVENGSYTFWGYEHIFGTVSQSPTSTAGTAGQNISNAVKAYVLAHYGTATGAVGPTYSAQSPLIPISLLQITRSGDGGFPAPKN